MQHEESLAHLAKLGTDISKLDDLKITKSELDLIANAEAIIKRGATAITVQQARTLPGWEDDRLKRFENMVLMRANLQAKNTANENAAAELARLKQQTLEKHVNLYPDEKRCPLCGSDWQSHASMLKAIEDRAQEIANTLSTNGHEVRGLITSMTSDLSAVENHIRKRETTLKPIYNDALYKALNKIEKRLPAIQQLARELQDKGIKIAFTFDDNDEVVARRLEYLRNEMRSKKTAERVLPPTDWRDIIGAAFKSLQDFYIFDNNDLKKKEIYIKIKANEAQNIKLKKCSTDLQNIRRENDAAEKAKNKINNLRATLEEVEQKYTDQTISEIELIFHIYSGRLIQNYQRGLGLFIESRKGKQLQFLTAEKSDHDAVMSMSSGQVSALSLAFFLSLNRVYAKVPLLLIDDPSQSLDDVNIASLTDLLRCELKHCQLIVSSHEEDISAYMRYRFERAGLTTNSLNMQRLAKEA